MAGWHQGIRELDPRDRGRLATSELRFTRTVLDERIHADRTILRAEQRSEVNALNRQS